VCIYGTEEKCVVEE